MHYTADHSILSLALLYQAVQDLLLHMKYPEVYKRMGASPPKGFLLHGPPGCGKTLMAHAIAGVGPLLHNLGFTVVFFEWYISLLLIAQELKLPFFKLAATELVSGVSGESEERVRKIFQKAAVSFRYIEIIAIVVLITNKKTNRQLKTELTETYQEYSGDNQPAGEAGTRETKIMPDLIYIVSIVYYVTPT